MSRATQLIAIAACVAMAGAAVARPGRVIKIERRGERAVKPIALCTRMHRDLTCFTGDVKAGDRLEIVDDAGFYQRVKVTKVKPNPMSCGPGRLIDAETRVLERRSRGSGAPRRPTAFGGLSLRPGVSRLVDPGNLRAPPGARGPARIGLDVTGDGRAEVIITVHDCSSSRRSIPGLSGRKNVQSFCVGTWRRPPLSTRWELADETSIHICP